MSTATWLVGVWTYDQRVAQSLRAVRTGAMLKYFRRLHGEADEHSSRRQKRILRQIWMENGFTDLDVVAARSMKHLQVLRACGLGYGQ